MQRQRTHFRYFSNFNVVQTKVSEAAAESLFELAAFSELQIFFYGSLKFNVICLDPLFIKIIKWANIFPDWDL